MCENLLMGSVFTHRWNVQAMKRYVDKHFKKKKKQTKNQSIKYITGPPKEIHTEEKNWHNRNFLFKK